jgi:hypothetical protein
LAAGASLVQFFPSASRYGLVIGSYYKHVLPELQHFCRAKNDNISDFIIVDQRKNGLKVFNPYLEMHRFREIIPPRKSKKVILSVADGEKYLGYV